MTADGQRIEAHGGGFLLEGDTWYWIGEDKSHNAAGFRAVNCYASRDLSRWEFRNAIITRDTPPELRASDRIIERPKLIYNERTRKYVMWLHWEGMSYATAEAGVFSSDTVCGDYTFHHSFRPNGNMARDDTLFKDDDGKAYFVAAARENADLIIYELTADYLEVARQLVTLWVDAYREAPALFKHEGRYFLVTSGATGWDPNQARYASATSLAGPWSALQNLGNGTSYDTQPTFILPIHGSKTTTYVYAGDRWQDPDLGSSKYIWLPLKLSGTSLTLDDYEQWTLNLTTGEWSAQDDYLPQSSWKLLRATSEEVEAENGAASRAFDDSPSTFWHTRYSGGTMPQPHAIEIDLGAEHALTAMRYLPRQDGNPNGTVAQYELYASLDSSDWGAAVSSGELGAGASGKRVNFPAKKARYVRFVAAREVAGRPHTSIAELDFASAP